MVCVYPCTMWICWILIVLSLMDVSLACLPCNCDTVMTNPPGSLQPVAVGKKVDCKNKTPGSSAWDLKLPQDTLELDLSENGITSIPKEALVQYTALQKLDLSNNHISTLEPGSFLGLSNLIKLDLSNNKIGNINNTMFIGLSKLQKLILARNQLKGVPRGTFNALTKLRRLDLQSEYLVCDCHLQWIVRWAKTNNVRLSESTTCSVPRNLRGKVLKRLKRRDLHCEWPIELPLFELKPKKSQVVFQGDKLPFECRASVIDPHTKMLWVRHERMVVSNKSEGILVHTAYSPDQSVMTHSLLIASLEPSYTGVWKCVVQTSRGNVSKTVNIIVYAKDAKKCAEVTTRTNKGMFTWPKTISGVQASLPCVAGPAATYLGTSEPQVTYTCNSQAKWVDLDDRQCQYISEVTRVLEQYTLTPLNTTNVWKLANRLKTYISNPRTIGDKIDLIYISRILDRFSTYVPSHSQMGNLLYDIVSDMMKVDKDLLYQSQVEDGACSRMTKLLERIPVQLLARKKVVRIYTDNIALEGHLVDAGTFPGMVCRAYRPMNLFEKYSARTFTCTKKFKERNETRSSFAESAKGLDGLIDIPETIFQQIGSHYQKYRLQFIVYKNSNLFPITSVSSPDTVTALVSSTVLSCKISESRVSNLSDPVVITLQTSKNGHNLRSVFWDYNANDGKGDWSTEGCHIMKQFGNTSVSHCDHMTNFAILQDEVTTPTDTDMETSWDVSRTWASFVLHPVIYAGSGICTLCLAATLLTYLSCFSHIKTPKKTKHSLINICLSVLLLCVGYTFGVNRVDHEIGCKVVGVGIHYFTIATLFWITVTSSIMYKKLTKKTRCPQPQTDTEEPQDVPPPKPVLGFYFLSYGVPVIICGITVAVSMEHYIRTEYCFLAWEPSLGAFYAPVGLLVLINCIFFICIACVLRGSTQNVDPGEETEDLNPSAEIESATENGEAQLVRSELHSSVLDLEYKPINQLRALVLLLFLFVVMWTAGAFAAAAPFRNIIPHMKTIFSYVYGVVSAMLGVFVLVYFCLARIDTRSSWKRFFCCVKREDYDVHTNTINLTSINTANHNRNVNGHVLQRRNSAESEVSNKTDKTGQSLVVALNPRKESNINLVPSVTENSHHSGTEHAAHFYNPRQNGVARKFWQRKHNQLKILKKDLKKEVAYSDKNVNQNADFRREESPMSEMSRSRPCHEEKADSLAEYDKTLLNDTSECEPCSDPPPGYKSGVTGSSGSELPLCNIVQPSHDYHHSYDRKNVNNASTLPIGFNGEYTRNDFFDYELDQGVYENSDRTDSPVPPVGTGRSKHASSPTLPSPPPPSDPPPPLEFEPEYVPPDISGHYYNSGNLPNILQHQRIPPLMDFNEPVVNNYSHHMDVRHHSPFEEETSRYMVMKSPHGLVRHSSHSRSPDSDNQLRYEKRKKYRLSPESGNFSGSGPRGGHGSDFMNEIEQRIPSYGARHFSPARSDRSDSNPRRCYKSADSDNQSQNSINRRSGTRKSYGDNRGYSDKRRQRHSRGSRSSMERRDQCQSPDSGSQSETGRLLSSRSSRGERQRSHDSCQSDSRLLSVDSGSQSESKLRSQDSSYQSGSDNKTHLVMSDGQSSSASKHARGKRKVKKQRSSNWEEQFKDVPRKTIPYVYVNHKYQDKMATKSRHHSAGDDDGRYSSNDAYNLPRSMSAYEQGVKHAFMDSDESSSNDSDEDIWVPRREIKPFKNETSV